jgi:superfamily I DNA and RNA helicase
LKGVPLGENGVEVLPIFELCEKLLGSSISLEKEETAYYDLVIDEALKKDPGERYRYDAVLVDEGQDFDTRMLQVALNASTLPSIFP